MYKCFHRVPCVHPLLSSLVTLSLNTHTDCVSTFSLRQVRNMEVLVYCPIILQNFEFDHHSLYALLELLLLYLRLPGNDSLI